MAVTHIKAPGKLTDIYTSEVIKIGTQHTEETSEGTKRYVFCINQGTTSTVAGDVLGAFLTTPVTGHFSRLATTVVECSLSDTMWVVGIALSVLAEDEMGWIQVGGYSSNITTDQGISAGDGLICDGDATPTFIAETASATEEHMVFGFADADDATAVGSGWLTNCAWDF